MEKTVAQELWPQKTQVQLLSKLFLAVLIILVYGVIQTIRHGLSYNDNLILIVGSILSFMAAFGYALAGYVYGATGRKSFFAMFLALAGVIPWAFGSYLCFYKGFYGLLKLQDGFSLFVILTSIFFIYLGYCIVLQFFRITETDADFQKFIKEGGFLDNQNQ